MYKAMKNQEQVTHKNKILKILFAYCTMKISYCKKLHAYSISFKTTPECYIFQSVQNISDTLTGLLDNPELQISQLCLMD